MTQLKEIFHRDKTIILYSVIFITLFEATAQVCLKKFQLEKYGKYIYLLFAVFFYILVGGLLCYCYNKNAKLGSVNLMWSCMSIIAVILFGYVFLQENIKHHDLMAILFAFLAIYYANQN